MKRVFVAALILLAGCRTKHPAYNEALHYPLLPPATFGQTAEFEHLLQGNYEGRTFDLHALIKIDPRELLVVGLTPIGTRAFTIRYDGQKVEADNTSGRKFPFPPELILSDIEEMFWPALPDRDGWKVKVTPSGKGREFIYAGQTVASVQFGKEAHGRRTIDLINLKYNYRLRLQIIEANK